MAHECPECGIQCHCGGDIDDCLLNTSRYVNACTHCPIDGPEDGEYPDEDGCDFFRDEDEGCMFPGKCLMPGDHLRSECHTVEQIQAYEREQSRGWKKG